MITSMREHHGYLYLGGILNNRIGRYKLDGADPELRPVRPALGAASMIAALQDFADQLLGRGEAAITVPPLDGALKPNQMLDEAETVAELEAPEDLATDGDDALRRRRRARCCARRRRGDRRCAQLRSRRSPRCAACRDGGLAVALDGTRGTRRSAAPRRRQPRATRCRPAAERASTRCAPAADGTLLVDQRLATRSPSTTGRAT